jgi:putative N6-adenine-specific DNA methylase
MRDRKPRSFAFEGWQAYQAHTWDDEVRLAVSGMLDRAPVRLVASDRDAGAVAAALQNARRAGVEDDIELSQRALSAIDAPGETGVMVVNPPYGKRVGEQGALRNLYASLGKVLRSRFSGWEVVMLSASAASEKQTALSFYSVARTSNGGIPVRIVRALVDAARGESNRTG